MRREPGEPVGIGFLKHKNIYEMRKMYLSNDEGKNMIYYFFY